MSNLIKDNILSVYNTERDRLVKLFKNRCDGSEMDAEDIVQEAFTRALQYSSSAPSTGLADIEPWLYRICHNCFLDNRDANRRSGTVDLEAVKETEHVPYHDESLKYARSLLSKHKRFTYGLPDHVARGVHLHFFNGYNTVDLSLVFGHSVWYWQKVIKKVRKSIVDEAERQGYYSGGKWVLVAK